MDKPFLPIDTVLIEAVFSALITIKKKKVWQTSFALFP